MGFYRKKPVEIQAFLVDGENTPRLAEMIASRSDSNISNDGVNIYIDTLEGTMKADIGDYIIIGVQKEAYPCKPDIFTATYDPI